MLCMAKALCPTITVHPWAPPPDWRVGVIDCKCGVLGGRRAVSYEKHWPGTFFHFPGSSTDQLGDLGKLFHLCEP